MRLEYLRERTCKCRIVLHITRAITWPLAGQGVITCHTPHSTRVWNFCQNKFSSSQLWIMKSLMQRILHYEGSGLRVSRRHEVSGRDGEGGSRSRSWRSFSIYIFWGIASNANEYLILSKRWDCMLYVTSLLNSTLLIKQSLHCWPGVNAFVMTEHSLATWHQLTTDPRGNCVSVSHITLLVTPGCHNISDTLITECERSATATPWLEEEDWSLDWAGSEGCSSLCVHWLRCTPVLLSLYKCTQATHVITVHCTQ